MLAVAVLMCLRKRMISCSRVEIDLRCMPNQFPATIKATTGGMNNEGFNTLEYRGMEPALSMDIRLEAPPARAF